MRNKCYVLLVKIIDKIFFVFFQIQVKSFLESGLRGVVLETFGCGNFTSTRNDLVLEIKNAVDRGILLISCTQCYSGNIAPNYQTGQVRNLMKNILLDFQFVLLKSPSLILDFDTCWSIVWL